MSLAEIAKQARKDEQDMRALIEQMKWSDTSDIPFDEIVRVHNSLGQTASALEGLIQPDS